MDEKLLLSIFVGVEGAHAFSAFMPSYFTVKKFALEPNDLKDLRSGYPPAIAFNLILGLVVSGVTKTIYPLLVCLLVSGFMVFMYEQAVGGTYAKEK